MDAITKTFHRGEGPDRWLGRETADDERGGAKRAAHRDFLEHALGELRKQFDERLAADPGRRSKETLRAHHQVLEAEEALCDLR